MQKFAVGVFTGLVSDEDVDLISYQWLFDKKSGPIRRQSTRRVRTIEYMRAIIAERKLGRPLQEEEKCIYKDKDVLNNQRDNILVGDINAVNQHAKERHGTTSRYKGVYLEKRTGKWAATIKITEEGKTKQIWLGRHGTEKEAAESYNSAAQKYFGEFAWLNAIEDDVKQRPPLQG